MSESPDTERFGGPGSSHQDREQPGKNHQPTGHKDGGGATDAAPSPKAPTETSDSHVAGGKDERRHRTTPEQS